MAKPSVALFDYGSGNLRSAFRALERAGADVELTSDLDQARNADGLFVPGVGAFAACMAGIEKSGVDAVIRARAASQRPVLGVCVGAQVLFAEGIEHGVETAGVGVFEGRVDHLEADRVPHMGWNTVTADEGMRLFTGIDPEERFYFVHSYAAKIVPEGALVATTVHGEPFIAAVERGSVAATQFHPEKSGDAGAALLTNWIEGLS
ncbi:imidazole glycerol phosphate synthase subunit HisH [Glycomyces buryatensis]|uniref:Imidazole glycerol phosphate synthase subunit HisH n=1 Tax=Glycomyces buryatensis TaxID=2570927 RepID=A0A4S8QFW5_9ACTN|nr:imidazole glycerol phosphate synthase subunit HisH [Glycomyces buryatensis]THV39534.1 imidazole glycerol phosphate synthase subunit HisH [Glycomyces buryatensis]